MSTLISELEHNSNVYFSNQDVNKQIKLYNFVQKQNIYLNPFVQQ